MLSIEVRPFCFIRSLALVALAPWLLTTLGCGEAVNEATVSGNVTVGGQPSGKASLSFIGTTGGRAIIASVAPDGSYEVKLPPGEYTATLHPSLEPPPGWKEGEPLPEPEVKIPIKYTQRNNTPLKLTITSTDSLKHDIVVP